MSLAMTAAKNGRPLRSPAQMGDPGFWSFLKDSALSVVSAVTPGPVSSIASALRPNGGQVVPPGGPKYPVAVKKPGVVAAAQRFLPGGETGLGAGCPKGFHPNKSSYWLKDGTFVEKHTKCVRHRRRYNPANAQATSRSIGRVNSAKRMQGALSEISTGKYTASGKRKPHTHR
jgi:hypothetical protein